jgi:phage-related protein
MINWYVKLLAPSITNAFKTLSNYIGTVVETIANATGNIVEALDGVIDFVMGIFTADWKKAWTGVKKFFINTWESISSVLSGIVNLIIDYLMA